MTFQAILDSIGMSIENLVVLMAGLTAAASSAAVWATLLHKDPAARRARVLAAQGGSHDGDHGDGHDDQEQHRDAVAEDQAQILRRDVERAHSELVSRMRRLLRRMRSSSSSNDRVRRRLSNWLR